MKIKLTEFPETLFSKDRVFYPLLVHTLPRGLRLASVSQL